MNKPFFLFIAALSLLLTVSGYSGQRPSPGKSKGLETEAPSIAEEKVPAALLSEFSTDFGRRIVSFDEIMSGGPPKDGIPAIDVPKFIPPEKAAEWINPKEPVILVRNGNEVKLYPLKVLMYHEIVNDLVDGLPLAVTYCPLCNTGIVFRREIDGSLLDFGTTGRLRLSNLIMYDRQTESFWQQGDGRSLMGFYAGEKLEFHPSLTVPFGEAARRYPDSVVLSMETGFDRPYGRNPYAGYDTGSPWAYRGPEIAGDYNPLERIVAVTVHGETVNVSYTELKESRIKELEIGGINVAVFWFPGTLSALDSGDMARGRDVGTANAFTAGIEDRNLSFRFENGEIVDSETGSQWDVTGTAVSGPLAGESLSPVTATQHFWFSAWAFRGP